MINSQYSNQTGEAINAYYISLKTLWFKQLPVGEKNLISLNYRDHSFILIISFETHLKINHLFWLPP